MSVRGRLISTFAVVTAILLAPALYAALRLSELRDLAVEGRAQQASAILTLGHIEASLAQLNRLQRSFVATGDSTLGRDVRSSVQRLDSLFGVLQASHYRESSMMVMPVLREIGRRSRAIEGLMRERRVGDATQEFTRMEALFPAASERLGWLARNIDSQAQQDFDRARAISSSARRSTLLGVGIFFVLALVVGMWTTGALTRPLRQLARATARVAEGQFHAPDDLPYERHDEIGALSRSFHGMTERLAELDRMKAEFVGVASHELKTPINVIQGYAELIEEGLAGELTPQQAEVLQGIAEQTDALTRLVSRLMDISRLETGTYRIEMEDVHIQDLVTGLARSFDILADQKRITLETDVKDSAPRSLVMDVDIIRDEVLGNLVSNALKHTPEGGTVRITVWGEKGGVVFEVADTGPGIPEEHRAHIFEKYFQVERSKAMGAGLGLAIAREMVEMHEGRIELVDEPGPGATFRVFLPGLPLRVRESALAPRA